VGFPWSLARWMAFLTLCGAARASCVIRQGRARRADLRPGPQPSQLISYRIRYCLAVQAGPMPAGVVDWVVGAGGSSTPRWRPAAARRSRRDRMGSHLSLGRAVPLTLGQGLAGQFVGLSLGHGRISCAVSRVAYSWFVGLSGRRGVAKATDDDGGGRGNEERGPGPDPL
jgi:hypothetical protein